MSKSRPTTSQREYFTRMLRRNASARNGRRMEAIYSAWYEGAIWPRVADPYGIYSGTEQFYEAVPLMRTIPHDANTYRCFLASVAPERWADGINGDEKADRLNRMWTDLEAEATAGCVRPLKLTRYLADVRESGTLRPLPAHTAPVPRPQPPGAAPAIGAVPSAARTELRMPPDVLRAMAAAAAATGRSETEVWAEAAREWLLRHTADDDPRPPDPAASARPPAPPRTPRDQCWTAIDILLGDLRATTPARRTPPEPIHLDPAA